MIKFQFQSKSLIFFCFLANFLFERNFYYANENYKFQNINGSIKLKLNRKMNGSSLICEDDNSIGKSILNYSLDILCKNFIFVLKN